VAAAVTNNTAIAPANVMFSSALIYPGVPDRPEGHDICPADFVLVVGVSVLTTQTEQVQNISIA
jgi:hypothetical protein